MLLTIGCAVQLAAQPVPSSGSGAIVVPARARNAVVTLLAYGATGDAFATSTGFVAQDGRVVSTLRPLRGAMRVELYGAGGDMLATATSLVQADVQKDLAVFARLAPGAARLTTSRRRGEFGQKVAVLGPRGGTGDGIAAATIAAVEESERGRVMRLDAQLASSFVGGPVVAANGELLGVMVGAISGRDELGLAVDVADLRALLAQPPVRLGFPTRDGRVSPLTESPPQPAPRRNSAPTTREIGVLDRFGPLTATDSVKAFTVEWFGCGVIESRQRLYCHLRITNRGPTASIAVSGAALTSEDRRQRASAEYALVGDSTVRIAGRGTKAVVQLREQEFRRLALEFSLPGAEVRAPTQLQVEFDGEKAIWFRPLNLHRPP
jgi:hypothetical protein